MLSFELWIGHGAAAASSLPPPSARPVHDAVVTCELSDPVSKLSTRAVEAVQPSHRLPQEPPGESVGHPGLPAPAPASGGDRLPGVPSVAAGLRLWIGSATGSWEALDPSEGEERLVGGLRVDGRSIDTFQEPLRLLVEVGEPPVEGGPSADDDPGNDGQDSEPLVVGVPIESARPAEESPAKRTPVALHNAELAGEGSVVDEPEYGALDDWRLRLEPGNEVDLFDERCNQWREGAVVRCCRDREDLVVRFRGDIRSDMRTTRSAGLRLQFAGTSPKHGDFVRAGTHVADWRSRLREGMDFEILVNSRGNFYYCKENDTILHYVPKSGDIAGRWWLSRREWNGATAVETVATTVRGYLRSGKCEETDCPPASVPKPADGALPEEEGAVWELWNSDPWLHSSMVQVEVLRDSENSAPTIKVTVDPDLVNFRSFDDIEWPGILPGVYVHSPEHCWQKRRIASIDPHTREARLLKLVQLARNTWDAPGEAVSETDHEWQPVQRRFSLISNTALDQKPMYGFRELRTLQPKLPVDLTSGNVADTRRRLIEEVVGLPNIGNTCYMNSVLQCIVACPSVTGFFADPVAIRGDSLNTQIYETSTTPVANADRTRGPNTEDLRRRAFRRAQRGGTGGILARAFSALVCQIARTEHMGHLDRDENKPKIGRPLGPLGWFKATLDQFRPDFRAKHDHAMGHQHDAMDVLENILDLLHQDINTRASVPEEASSATNDGRAPSGPAEEPNMTADMHWRQHRERDASVIMDTFEGQLSSCLSCPKHPKQASRTFDAFKAIPLSVPDQDAVQAANSTSNSDGGGSEKNDLPVQAPNTINTLSSCLRGFLSAETDIRWHCDDCAADVSATKKIDLCRLPPILCFHFKRFMCTLEGVTRKVGTLIDFPFEIFMDEYVADSATTTSNVASPELPPGDLSPRDTWLTGQQLYELIGVSNQMGDLRSGHYTAFSKRGTEWFLCDDERIAKKQPQEVRTANAYLLFYRALPAGQLDTYLRNIIAEAGLEAPSQDADGRAVRAAAWDARRLLLQRAKEEADAAAAKAAAEARALAIVKAGEKLAKQLDEAEAAVAAAAIDPISDAMVQSLKSKVAAAEAAGVNDAELLKRARDVVQEMFDVAAAAGNIISILSEEALLKLIASAGMEVPSEAADADTNGRASEGKDLSIVGNDDDVDTKLDADTSTAPDSGESLKKLQDLAREAQQRLLAARDHLAVAYRVPSEYDPLISPQLRVTNPFTRDFLRVPDDAKPGETYLIRVPKPVEQLEQLRTMGFDDERVCLEALADAVGNVQVAVDTLFENADAGADSVGSKVVSGVPLSEAIFHVPLVASRGFVPGQLLVVRNPYSKGLQVRTLPKDWRPGKDLVLHFPTPRKKLDRFRHLGFSDERECLDALMEAQGSYESALAVLHVREDRHRRRREHDLDDVVVQGIAAPLHDADDQLEVVDGEVVASSAAAGSEAEERRPPPPHPPAPKGCVNVVFPSVKNGFSDMRPGDFIELVNPFTGDNFRYKLPKSWVKGTSAVIVALPEPTQLLTVLRDERPGLSDDSYVAALQRAELLPDFEGKIKEAVALLNFMVDLRSKAGAACDELSDAACFELLHQSGYKVHIACVYLGMGPGPITDLANTGDVSAFRHAWDRHQTEHQRRANEKQAKAFYDKVKESTDAMGLENVTPVRVKALVRKFGYHVESVISGLFGNDDADEV